MFKKQIDNFYIYFNSTLVRFKRAYDPTGTIYFHVFQFYFSPIQTTDGADRKDGKDVFQFYFSPIQTIVFDIVFDVKYLFQFYFSPIQTQPICLEI